MSNINATNVKIERHETNGKDTFLECLFVSSLKGITFQTKSLYFMPISENISLSLFILLLLSQTRSFFYSFDYLSSDYDHQINH